MVREVRLYSQGSSCLRASPPECFLALAPGVQRQARSRRRLVSEPHLQIPGFLFDLLEAGHSASRKRACAFRGCSKVQRQRGDGLSILLQVHRLSLPASRETAPRGRMQRRREEALHKVGKAAQGISCCRRRLQASRIVADGCGRTVLLHFGLRRHVRRPGALALLGLRRAGREGWQCRVLHWLADDRASCI